jgi:hypothetical protein
VIILGLAIGLSFVMLIANHSVTGKIATTLSSIGNIVTIGLSGYPADGQLAKNLTTAELAPIAQLHGVTSIDEILNGTAAPSGTTRNATRAPRPAHRCAPATSALRCTSPDRPSQRTR